MNGSKKNRRGLIAASAVGATAVVLAGGAYAYAASFGERALPNTVIAGHSVTGKTEGEIAHALADLEKSATVDVSLGGATTTVSLSDLGVDVDEAATAKAVVERSHDVLPRFQALFSHAEVAPVVSRDEARLASFVSGLSSKQGPAPKNAIVRADESGAFVVDQGAPGVVVDPAPLAASIDRALASLAPTSAVLEAKSEDPQATTEEAQKVADAANALIAPAVELGDGIESFTASPADKASWVALPEIPDESAAPVLDEKAIGAWVDSIAAKTDVAPLPALDNVDASGNVLVEGARPGKSGLKTNNAPAKAQELIAALKAGTAYSSTFDYDKVEPGRETRPVMAGYEGFAYPMAEGEKWIDVDLSANRLTAYEGQTPVLGPYPINHGSPGHETVTGLFHVYLQYEKQDMGCTPGWPYCAKDVPWVSYFTGSYAIHGAPWVSYFGRGSVQGSHGCVNLPVDQAHAIFGWAPLGTPVKSHY